MLKVMFKDALKTPGKLLALCLVVYLATISIVVAGFLILLAVSWVKVEMKKKAKAIEAAEAEAEAARIETEKLAAAARAADAAKVRTADVAHATEAANDAAAQPAPTKQYAKSAVVVPFRTGTQ
ncbi:hypothetical protein BJG93_33095 (plasmid) [Paraburkholderia sprentiae WSM5005]|uniref:Uncharacterized protein n=1 Tax=Paraburkholderia sprentiae WSM5005 TaxID=754502 RepID=A0A1I9YW26_9BURK|nr:hypothetical protein [Paraburkholderia sprentiae]APA90427.1 hypothetical protein BJG93_33095 [Paraburkholderia sprentiae WSM5005]